MYLKNAILLLSEKYSKDRSAEDQALVEKDLTKILNNYLQVLDTNGNIGFIAITDVLYLDTEYKKVELITKNNCYISMLPEELIDKLIAEYRFEYMDRDKVVNLDQVAKYCSQLGRIYFSWQDIGENKDYIQFAWKYLGKLKKTFGKEYDIANNPTTYAPIKKHFVIN